jgi:large conductance mechanosensitive channel
MHFFHEFKTFLFRGNVLELAIAVIIGSAFGTIVSSLVDDIITPLLLSPALKAAKVSEIASLSWGSVKYGSFIAASIKFVLIAMILFMVLKTVKRFQKLEAEKLNETTPTEKLLTEIRDLLKK